MVTAAPVNERLSDTRVPAQSEVVQGAPRSRLPGALRGARGPGPGGAEMSGRAWAAGLGLPHLTDSGTRS